MHRDLACMFMHTCKHSHTQKCYVHKLSHAQDCRVHPEKSHVCPYNHTHVSRLHVHLHVAHRPFLPVACTRHSLDVKGCTSGRRGLVGRTPAGTDQDPPIL